ncbi:MAG TPA: protein kinase [Vicinamibacterales bacterium]|nr:protein kinase [Vicinamibacterales bacterium]
MSLVAGSRIGLYEILNPLGAGGMGEVYRGRDPKLQRDVAIKILPELFANDPDRRARFEREARALASLNHPNIAQIYGVEDTAGTPAIVMELVEGEDLAARIARGPLTWAEALPIARQIAEALDAAHERGIIHRDLKPANVKITPGDTVKVLDFGLAKAIAGSDTAAADPQNSPTFTSPATRLGMIVGTAAYMAPEQAKGKAVDKRADIWAFGCVLYEMLTGRSPFGSDSAAESIGLIVTRDPDWAALPPSTPSRAVQLIRRCLLKDPRQRLRDIGDASYLLARPDDAPEDSAGAARQRFGGRAWLAPVAALVFAAAASGVTWYLKPAPAVPLRRIELSGAIAAARAFAIAPDGDRLAYLSNGHLYVRELHDTTPRDLGPVPPASDFLFWSPDSRSIGFVAEAAIRTVPAAGGPMFTVCRIPVSGRLMGVDWRTDDTLVFSVWRDSLYTVPVAGGTPAVRLTINTETEVDFHNVTALPDGRLIVGVHVRQGDFDRTELVDGDGRTILNEDPTLKRFQYVPPGFLLFHRTGANEGVWTAPFSEGPVDLTRARLVEPGATEFDAADDGTLIVRSESPSSRALVWIGRDGSTTNVPGLPIAELSPRVALSPAGDRAAFIAGPRGAANVVVRDLGTGVDTRLTFTGKPEAGATWTETLYPSWFPAGDRLLYASGPVEGLKVVAHRVDGAGAASELVPGIFGRVSRDGRWLLWIVDERGHGRLRYGRLNADGSLADATALSPADDPDVRWFDLSPDNRFVAYSARGSNSQMNIHLTEFPSGAGRWQVTTDGGTHPRFSADGRELFFLAGGPGPGGAPQGRVMMMPLTLRPSVKLGVAVPVVSADAGGTGPSMDGFDVARDGRLLMSRRLALPSGSSSRVVLVQNWPAAIQRR